MHIKNVNIHLSGAPSVALLAALSGAFAPGGAPVEKASRPAIGQYWEGQGGVYVGVGRGYEGSPDYCLILPTDPRAIFTKRTLGTIQKLNTISAAIGQTVIKDVSTRTIADFLAGYAEKERMQQAMRSLLIDVFREAMMAGWCDKNPAEVTRAQRVETKRERLSLEQFQAIHAEVVANGPVWLPHFMELALLTGQRRGDVATMRYRDIADGWHRARVTALTPACR